MLPTLSRLSVSIGPGCRLRHRYSSRYLRISPLHLEFYNPLPYSILAVSNALSRLSRGLSHLTYKAAYTRFTPSNSEQRSHPPYYRGCWHGVSRCFLKRYRQAQGVLFPWVVRPSPTRLYDPKAFITHATSLRQAFAHCAIFPTAASRRSLDRVSVPVWLIVLLDQLPVVALVGHYPTNKLMGRGLILWRQPKPSFPAEADLCGISTPFEVLSPTKGQITHVILTRSPLYSHPKVLSRSTCMC